MCKQIFKAYLGMSIIHVKMNSLIMQATREEKSNLPITAQGKNIILAPLNHVLELISSKEKRKA